MVILGDEVKDSVTGYQGIAYARITYLQGCTQIGIQAPVVNRKGQAPIVPKLYYVDEAQIVVTKQVNRSFASSGSGGPSGFFEVQASGD